MGNRTSFIVNCYKIIPEKLITDKEAIIIREGEYAFIKCETEPYTNEYIVNYASDDTVVRTTDTVTSDIFAYAISAGEANLILSVYLYPDIRKEIPVTVLPKDASMAEHIVYSNMRSCEVRSHYLSEHNGPVHTIPTWISSEETVATVDNDGNVTAVGKGTAVITASCDNHHAMFGVNVDEAVHVETTHEERAKVFSQDMTIFVSGLEKGDHIMIFDPEGRRISSHNASDPRMSFPMERKGVFIVTVGADSFKVIL